jgi:hypothetical protein
MTSQREMSARIAMEYITARASDVRDRTTEEALTEASHDIYHLVDGLTHLVVGLARRLAAAESVTVEKVLQQEVLRLLDHTGVASPATHQEVATPEPHEPAPVRVRVQRPEVPRQAAAFEDLDDELPPDQWTA